MRSKARTLLISIWLFDCVCLAGEKFCGIIVERVPFVIAENKGMSD